MAIDVDVARLYSVSEVAQVVGMPQTSVRTWLDSGQLHGVKMGKVWRVHGDELQRLLREGTRPESEEYRQKVAARAARARAKKENPST